MTSKTHRESSCRVQILVRLTRLLLRFLWNLFFLKIIGILFIKNDSMEKGIRNFYFLEGLQTNNHMETSVSLVESSKGKGSIFFVPWRAANQAQLW